MWSATGDNPINEPIEPDETPMKAFSSKKIFIFNWEWKAKETDSLKK